jgi:hypothetical protein
MSDVITDRTLSAGALFREHVRPIYFVKRDRTTHHLGSCFFVKVAGHHLMVTAAHVVDAHAFSKLQVAVQGRLCPLDGIEGFMTTPPGGIRDRDHYDFAILRLPIKLVEALPELKFIEEKISQAHSIDPGGRVYMALGFPTKPTNPITRSERLSRNRWLLDRSHRGMNI